MSTSLVDIIRKRFLDTIRSVNPPDKWKVLVVDEHSQALLGAVLKTYDVLEENVTVIESITTRRSPQPTTEAIYLLMPTTANVQRIISDFSGNERQYAAAHVFFLDGLSEQLFERLASSPAEPYLRQLVELFLNIQAFESRVFNLKAPEMFYSMLSPPRDAAKIATRVKRLDNELKFASKVLLNICISLNENPLIRYFEAPNHGPLGPFLPSSLDPSAQAQPTSSSNPYYSANAAPPPSETGLRWARQAALKATEVAQQSASGLLQQYGGSSGAGGGGDQIPRKLATMLQADLDEYRKSNPDFPKYEPQRPRGTLIITDRTMDLFAPLLHEFTYQAMANDLLHIKNGRSYTYNFVSATGGKGAREDRTAILGDADNVWMGVRHLHMKEAIDKLMADFNTFLQENAGFRPGDGAASLNDMKDMLAQLPQFQDMREKFSLHLTMAQECMDLFEKKKLPMTANVEQICATGLTAEHKVPKKLVEDMVPLLDDNNVSSKDKVRIIALYIMYRDGVPEEDQRRLFQHARLNLAEQDAVRALSRLGIRLNRRPKDGDTKKLKFKSAKDDGDDDYELSRYKPVLHHVLTEHINGKLDQSLFPYVRDAPTAFGALAGANASGGGRAGESGPIKGLSASARGAKTFGGGGGGGGAGAGLGGGSAPGSLRSVKASSAQRFGGGRPGIGEGTASFGSGSTRSGAVAEKDPIRQRVIVFVAGGMTYSEMRTVYQVGGKLAKDVYIGSTHILTPERFIDDLKVLEIEGVGSAALPEGLPSGSSGAGDYQEFYDKRYFTADAPAPPPGPSQAGGRSNGGNNNSSRPTNAYRNDGARPTPTQTSSASSLPPLAPPSHGGDGGKLKKKRGLFGF